MQHSHELKYFRDTAEEAGKNVVFFENQRPAMMKKLEHDQSIGEPRIPWKWQEMVAQLDELSMLYLVQGLQNTP